MGIVENIKDAADLAKKVGDLELYRKIVHLEGEVMDLTREKRSLEDKVEELERKWKLKAAMMFKAPFFYQQGDVTPFCPACYQGKEERAVHLTQNADGWYCTVCKNPFHLNPKDSRAIS